MARGEREVKELPVSKVCPQCATEKPAAAFSIRRNRPGRLTSWCLECARLKKAEYYKRTAPEQRAKYRDDPEYRARLNERTKARHHATYQSQQHRPGHLRRKYGLTPEQFDALVAHQHGVCAVCGLPETVVDTRGTAKLLSVDHDHETGVVRGLLCRKCNVALGLLRDDADLVGKLLAYILKGGSA